MFSNDRLWKLNFSQLIKSIIQKKSINKIYFLGNKQGLSNSEKLSSKLSCGGRRSTTTKLLPGMSQTLCHPKIWNICMAKLDNTTERSLLRIYDWLWSVLRDLCYDRIRWIFMCILEAGYNIRLSLDLLSNKYMFLCLKKNKNYQCTLKHFYL